MKATSPFGAQMDLSGRHQSISASHRRWFSYIFILEKAGAIGWSAALIYANRLRAAPGALQHHARTIRTALSWKETIICLGGSGTRRAPFSSCFPSIWDYWGVKGSGNTGGLGGWGLPASYVVFSYLTERRCLISQLPVYIRNKARTANCPSCGSPAPGGTPQKGSCSLKNPRVRA